MRLLKGYTTTRIRSLTLPNFLCGLVCEDCNGGWMSGLEVGSIDSLKALIAGSLRIEELSERSLASLAKWAAKTAYVLEASVSEIVKFPIEHARRLHADGFDLAPDVVVFGSQLQAVREIDWYCSRDWNATSPRDFDPESMERFFADSYKISFQIKQMAFVVAHLGMSGLRFSAVRGGHHPIGGSFDLVDWREYDPGEIVLVPGHFQGKMSPHRAFHLSLLGTLPG